MLTLRAVRELLVQVSRRHSRVAHEVEDLAHDIVVSALRRGASLDGESFVRSARAAAMQHGAFLARTAARRRAREDACRDLVIETESDPDDGVEGAPLSALSPTLRTTLLLLLLGLDKAELRAALRVSDATLRKRFQALREHAPLARPELALAPRTPAQRQLRQTQVEIVPRLAASARPARWVLAASDPDGHGIIFSESLTPGRLAATTTSASTPSSRRS